MEIGGRHICDKYFIYTEFKKTYEKLRAADQAVLKHELKRLKDTWQNCLRDHNSNKGEISN